MKRYQFKPGPPPTPVMAAAAPGARYDVPGATFNATCAAAGIDPEEWDTSAPVHDLSGATTVRIMPHEVIAVFDGREYVVRPRRQVNVSDAYVRAWLCYAASEAA